MSSGSTADLWQIQVPALFRALADPAMRTEVRTPRNDGFEAALGSWGALHYCFRNLLGWSDPGRGLGWWYREGKPIDDSPVLALVRDIWGGDDMLDYYAAWAWKPMQAGWLVPQSADPLHGPSPTELAKTSQWPDEDWWRNFLRRGQVQHHDPFYGGTDALHLRAHDAPMGAGSEDPLVRIDPSRRHVLLVTEGIDHWLSDLRRLERSLTGMGDRSWHVEVFDRQVGYLGRFRRSRTTGQWFLGKHSIHVRGAAVSSGSSGQ